MGFYIPEDNHQVRLRISYQSYETIIQDIAEFQNMPEKSQISSFLNKIINKFYNEAESTVCKNKQKIYEKYFEWLEGLENAEKTAKQLTKKEIQDRFKKIKEKYSQPPRANGENIKIIMTNDTIKKLKESQEKDLYENKISDYLAALIQEYTSLPREERERIYFNDIFEEIKDCVEFNKEAEVNNNKIVKFFKITTNGFMPYYYAVGYAKPIPKKDSELTAPWELITFRLQGIKSVEKKKVHLNLQKMNFQN